MWSRKLKCESPQTLEPLAQTWIKCKSLYYEGYKDLMLLKLIQSNRTRAGLNL